MKKKLKVNKERTIQIKVTKKEKEDIEQFIREKSVEDHKTYNLSSFLSQSIMDVIKQQKSDNLRLLLENE